ncbi:cytochrome P460 family protein [Rhizobium leguminosarum]|nr:cytochrome P460 family protein [Rhizobium leguminosarum]
MLVMDAEYPGARAEANAVTFPPIEEFEHYTTVERGVSAEHMMTSREALAALKEGTPVPVGTHMVLVDYRDGKVFRYFVSQKVGKGADEWAFQWFHPDRSIKADENTARCYSCHRSRQDSHFMFTLSEAQAFGS